VDICCSGCVSHDHRRFNGKFSGRQSSGFKSSDKATFGIGSTLNAILKIENENRQPSTATSTPSTVNVNCQLPSQLSTATYKKY
jgi:hypothetical protein